MPPTSKTRAPGMSRDDRRAMIVRAVLPLVVEYGASVTTSQLARAAGIGEGTIFRAFDDKDELLDACMAEAVRPDQTVQALTAIPLDLPLDQRLRDAVETLTAHTTRIGTLAAAMLTAGRPRPQRPDDGKRDHRAESFATLRDAVATVIAPDADRLRLSPERTASLLFSMQLGQTRHRPAEGGMSTAELVDFFLHGALREDVDA